MMVETDPTHPCDRCGHAMKMHAPPESGGMRCMIVEGRVYRGIPVGVHRANQCWCDGYVRRPRMEDE